MLLVALYMGIIPRPYMNSIDRWDVAADAVVSVEWRNPHSFDRLIGRLAGCGIKNVFHLLVSTD